MEIDVDENKSAQSSSAEGASVTQNTDKDASRDSSPAHGEQNEDSPPQGGGSDAAMTPAQKRMESFLSKKVGQSDDSPSTEEPDDKAKPEGDSAQDEPDGSQAKAKTPDALSQEQEQVFSKAFGERPEWAEAVKLAGPNNAKAMRGVLRKIFQHESALNKQVEGLKPAVGMVDRIRRCTGNDAGLENSIRLIEGWFDGTDEAEGMLEGLLTDLRARKGKTLTSDDLKQRLEDARAKLDDGILTEEQFKQAEKDLLEIEGARAGKKSLESRQQQTQQKQTEERTEKLVKERVTALDTWEKDVAKRDPDYKRIQRLVTDRASRIAEERHNTEKRWLTPDEMTAICDEAYKAIKAEVGGMLPKPRARSPLPEGEGSSSKFTEQEPSDPAKAILWRRQRAGK